MIVRGRGVRPPPGQTALVSPPPRLWFTRRLPRRTTPKRAARWVKISCFTPKQAVVKGLEPAPDDVSSGSHDRATLLGQAAVMPHGFGLSSRAESASRGRPTDPSGLAAPRHSIRCSAARQKE